MSLFLCERNVKKNITPTYMIVCVCIYSCFIDKNIAHYCFSIDKNKIQKKKIIIIIIIIKRTYIAVFGCTTGNTLNIFVALYDSYLCRYMVKCPDFS